MRPMNSSYDTRIAQSEAAAKDAVDPSACKIGDRISYALAGDCDDVGWAWLRDCLAAHGLSLEDDGSGYVVMRTEDTSYGRYLAAESRRWAEEDRIADSAEQT